MLDAQDGDENLEEENKHGGDINDVPHDASWPEGGPDVMQHLGVATEDDEDLADDELEEDKSIDDDPCDEDFALPQERGLTHAIIGGGSGALLP